MTTGGRTTVTNSAVGTGAVLHISSGGSGGQDETRKADVGVITALPVELRAVRDVLGLKRVTGTEIAFHEGDVEVRGRITRVVALRAVSPGQRSTVAAFSDLRQHYSPAVVVLTGIGGGIHPTVGLGDVVVATHVVYYDARKETPDGTRHRGEGPAAPASVVRAVNSFFDDHEVPAALQVTAPDGVTRSFTVSTGPIGSGEAVITDSRSPIREFVQTYNDKTCAVETEAGGLVQAFYEQSGPGKVGGWLVVRGISDHADAGKSDEPQAVAARHAAEVLRRLLPYLPTGRPAVGD
nr:hypothetical protein [Sphaerisporangium rubeum]